MNGRRYVEEEDDRDRTLRALEGNDRKSQYGGKEDQRQADDSSDYFLDLARDHLIISGINNRNSTSKQAKRRVGCLSLFFTPRPIFLFPSHPIIHHL